jgi:putative hemolysin
MKAKTLLFAFCILLTSCSVSVQLTDPQPTNTPRVEPTISSLPNPASVYCEAQGHTLEIRTAQDGSQSGVCIFSDGSECDEWAFYRGECQPASAEKPIDSPEIDELGWKIYTNESLGYNFHYPAEAQITENDNPLSSFSISGSELGTESWTIAHPTNREEYRPPSDMDLDQWLTDHYLMGENRQPDVQIAGKTAVHFRHERSPQSYAFDQYYFAHNGQLYQIIIGHSGETENAELNSRFLESFQFEIDTSSSAEPTPIPTAIPIQADYYQGFWTYTSEKYGFSIMLPEDWVVDETTTFDPLMNDHELILRPRHDQPATASIRLDFRSIGEETPLWPTGVGQGEFIQGGTLEVAGSPAQRIYLVCPDGQIQSIWYQGDEIEPNIQRGNLEFSFIYSYQGTYCEGNFSLTGKVQLVGEMIIASLKTP